ncbi:MAG: hypothetical protein PHP45_08905 [Elusimicrobiales bacterium]|nr:hypothetical protein [Elusimicrobiales bacterium]
MHSTTDAFFGLVCVLLGLGYVFRPDIIERINALIKNTILNDARIALERRKWGVFLILAGIFFLYRAFGPAAG